MLDADQCYRALLTRDSRFDGRFFIAVRSTRIYCRPICRAKPPLRQNCTFFSHAAAAEVAGYRPCKRCRPELAPGNSAMEVSSQLARRAATYIGDNFLAERSLNDLASELGVTDRQMRRVFRDEFGVSPVEFWQTQRLLLAKQLLTDTSVSVLQVAMASGFQSLRRFNALLKARYRMAPKELRRHYRDTTPPASPGVSCYLGYRPPYDWEQVLRFLAARAIPHVEAVTDGTYLRTVRLERQGTTLSGYVEVRHEPSRHRLSVRLSDSLLPVCALVLERMKRLFDLAAEPTEINRVLGPLARRCPGLRVPGAFDGFELAVRAVLGQQVSVAGASTLTGRLAARFGTPVVTPYPALDRAFPAAAELAREHDLRAIGTTMPRASTLQAMAHAVTNRELELEPGRRIEETIRQLRAIPGIGDWTEQYIAMRALAWPDAFPSTDLGLRRALKENSGRKILQLAEKWRPWRAYAALHLWNQHGTSP
jgi:AraC family transcriptional regulator of adaptative response / DNA-3-methyladenine glycosylase II